MDEEGASEEKECERGTYTRDEGQSSCLDAQPGYFVDADGASVARHVSRCDPRVLIAEAGSYYELRGGGV